MIVPDLLKKVDRERRSYQNQDSNMVQTPSQHKLVNVLQREEKILPAIATILIYVVVVSFNEEIAEAFLKMSLYRT